MKLSIATAFTLALASTQSLAECTRPDAPVLPDGATASMEQMLEGQKAVKAFQTANMAYMGCLEEAFKQAKAASETGTDEAKEAAMAEYTAGVDAYNAAVAQEEEVAGQFNTEIREYKAANPS
jgi:hypothetical protein